MLSIFTSKLELQKAISSHSILYIFMCVIYIYNMYTYMYAIIH